MPEPSTATASTHRPAALPYASPSLVPPFSLAGWLVTAAHPSSKSPALPSAAPARGQGPGATRRDVDEVGLPVLPSDPSSDGPARATRDARAGGERNADEPGVGVGDAHGARQIE